MVAPHLSVGEIGNHCKKRGSLAKSWDHQVTRGANAQHRVNPQELFCPNIACPARGQAGKGNVHVHSQKDKRCICEVCGQTFTTTTGTIFYRTGCVGYLAHPPRFVWLNRNLKKHYDANPSFRHMIQKRKYKKADLRRSAFLLLAQKVTLSGPDGDGTRVQLTNRSIAISINKYPIQFLRNGGNIYTLQALLGHTTLDMVKQYLAIAENDLDSDHEKASPVKVWKL
jgi:hypothetical protein